MIAPAIPVDETERLRTLFDYSILDTAPEKGFDAITRIAAELCQTPVAKITFVDLNRQWFKSSYGLPAGDTPRLLSFCAHAINQPEKPFIVPDALQDDRFCDNPYVVGEPHLVFYAGVPLVHTSGHVLGTLSVLDYKPRVLTDSQLVLLQALANQVMTQLELRKKVKDLEQSQLELQRGYRELDLFSKVLSQDLKMPLVNMSSLAMLLEMEYPKEGGVVARKYLGMLDRTARNLCQMVDGMLEFSTSGELLVAPQENVALAALLAEAQDSLPASTQLLYPPDMPVIKTNRVALQLILLNLLQNAVRYNDKSVCRIEIRYEEEKQHHRISITDNGPGIPVRHRKKVFDLFQTLGKIDRFHKKGNGVGLAVVKKLVQRSGGNITVASEPGLGATFSFTLKK